MPIPADLTGIFWRPDEPDEKLTGHLRTGIDDQIMLALHGSWAGFDQLLGGGRAFPILHGIAEGNRELTLFQCIPSGSNVSAFIQQRFWVALVFVGGQFSAEQLVFDELHFRTDHLADWTGTTGFQHTLPPPEGFRWQVGYREPDALVANLGNAGSVELAFESGMNLALGKVDTYENPVVLGKAAEPLGYHDIARRYLFPLRDLITFATATPAYIDEVSPERQMRP